MIIENENISKYLKILKESGYEYIVKAQDKFLSGWGNSQGKKHIQLIACVNSQEARIIMNDLEKDNSMGYINYWGIEQTTSIFNAISNKTYTIRNDWTRADYYMNKEIIELRLKCENKVREMLKSEEN